MAAPINPFTPPKELHPLLPSDVVTAIEAVDKLAARVADATARAHKYGPRADRADWYHGEAVRSAIAAGGSSSDVPDERAEWIEGYRQAREDKQALGPILEVAWRSLKEALIANTTEALAKVEPTVTEAADAYREAIEAAEAAAAEHRAKMVLRLWISTADRAGGPDPMKPTRETDVTAGRVSCTPSEAIGVLRADANALATLRERERHDAARRAHNDGIAAERKAAADARAAQEEAAIAARARQREQTRERELKATAEREARQIPGTPAA